MPKDTFFGRYIIEKSSNAQPKFFPTDDLTENPEDYGAAAGWTHVFNDHVLNELKLGLTHFLESLQLANAGKNDVVSQLGMIGLCEDPDLLGRSDNVSKRFCSFWSAWL